MCGGQKAASAKRINVTLDEEHAGKLARLAERTHVQEGTLARSLLSTALDDADPGLSLRNLKEDLEDIGSRFDGAADSEFRLATETLELTN